MALPAIPAGSCRTIQVAALPREEAGDSVQARVALEARPLLVMGMSNTAVGLAERKMEPIQVEAAVVPVQQETAVMPARERMAPERP